MRPGCLGYSGVKSAADLARAAWLEQYDWDSLWEQIDGRYGEAPRSAVEYPHEEPAR